jgi:hypothetical protein
LRGELGEPVVRDVEHPQARMQALGGQGLEPPLAEDQALSAGNDAGG